MWVLRTNDGPAGGLTFRVTHGSLKTLGRAVRADFVLDAPLVSRVHCRFTATAPGVLDVEDLESTNGTFVNGERVKRSALKAGDIVRVGRVEFAVERTEAQ
jgi:pSer/pThr/pTyr-binding forkhead associated (FHA) protein